MESYSSVNAAFLDALKLGHLEIAQFLYSNKSINISSIDLCQVKSGRCYEWFKKLFISALNAEDENWRARFLGGCHRYAGLTYFEVTYTYEDFIKRVIEVGDLALLTKNKQKRDYKDKINLNENLVYAASNNHLHIIEALIAMGVDINPNRPYKDAPIIAASKYNHEDVVVWLINHKANINYQGKLKETALMKTAFTGNISIFQKLTVAGADISLCNVFGQTVLHLAVENENEDLIEEIMCHSSTNLLANQQDIFGISPLDVAFRKGNNKIMALLTHGVDKNFYTLTDDWIDTNQGEVMKRMLYYLVSQYRETELFSFEGHCNGFVFLNDYYSEKALLDERIQNYFNSALLLMVTWDGIESSLKEKFTDIPQAKYYKNLQELFDGWIDHIIWFQHGEEVSDITGKQQDDRIYQYAMVSDAPFLLRKSIAKLQNKHLNVEQFIEWVRIYTQHMPVGTRMEIVGSEHATSAYYNQALQFEYYDPSLKRRTKKFTHEKEFINMIVDTKIIALDKFNSGFDCVVNFYLSSTSENLERLKKHEAFNESEIPTSKEDIENYQNKSPNRYTQLHIATIAGSSLSITKLMKSGYCDLYSQDIAGNTPLEIAILSGNDETIKTLLEYYPDSSVSLKVISAVFEQKNCSSLNALFKQHQKLHLPGIFQMIKCQANCYNNLYEFFRWVFIPDILEKNKLSVDQLFNLLIYVIYSDHATLASWNNDAIFAWLISQCAPAIINNLNSDNQTPLYLAAQSGNLNMLKGLIHAGAKINVICGENNETCMHVLLRARKINFDAIKLFLDNHVDLNIGDQENTTATDIVKQLNNSNLSELFEQYISINCTI